MLNERQCARQCICQEFRSYQTPRNFQLIILTQFDLPRSLIMYSGYKSIHERGFIQSIEMQPTSIAFVKQIFFVH